jgi:hypothetical protein
VLVFGLSKQNYRVNYHVPERVSCLYEPAMWASKQQPSGALRKQKQWAAGKMQTDKSI